MSPSDKASVGGNQNTPMNKPHGVEEMVGFVPACVSEVAAEPGVVFFGKGTEPADALDRVGNVLFGFSIGGQP